MRRLLSVLCVALLAFANAGCFINGGYSNDENERTETLIFQSEDLRQFRAEWRRFWFADQPSHMTYDRIHGGIGP